MMTYRTVLTRQSKSAQKFIKSGAMFKKKSTSESSFEISDGR